MKRTRLAVVAVLLGAAGCSSCIDLATPRGYPCDHTQGSGAQCPTGYRCGLEDYCHSTGVGAEYACRSDVDCEQGWRCDLAAMRCVDSDGEELPSTGYDGGFAVYRISPGLFKQAPDAIATGGGFLAPPRAPPGTEGLRSVAAVLDGGLQVVTWIGLPGSSDPQLELGARGLASGPRALSLAMLGDQTFVLDADGGLSTYRIVLAPPNPFSQLVPGASFAFPQATALRTTAVTSQLLGLSPAGMYIWDAGGPADRVAQLSTLGVFDYAGLVTGDAGEPHGSWVLTDAGILFNADAVLTRTSAWINTNSGSGPFGSCPLTPGMGTPLHLYAVPASPSAVVIESAPTPSGRGSMLSLFVALDAGIPCFPYGPCQPCLPGQHIEHVIAHESPINLAGGSLLADVLCRSDDGGSPGSQAVTITMALQPGLSSAGGLCAVRPILGSSAILSDDVTGIGSDNGSVPIASTHGQIWQVPMIDGGISGAIPLTLDQTPILLTYVIPPDFRGGLGQFPILFAAAGDDGYSLHDAGIGFTRVRSFSPSDGLSPRAAVRFREHWIVGSGGQVGDLSQGSIGVRVIANVAPTANTPKAPFHGTTAPLPDGGIELMVAAFDSVLSADVTLISTQQFAPQAELQTRAVPSPGIAITSFAAVQSLDPDAGVIARAFALSPSGLFQLDAFEQNRWVSTPVPLPPGPWQAVWTESHYARVGYRDGTVYSLPSRTLLALAFDGGTGVEDFAEFCGRTYALTANGLFRLDPTDASIGAWTAMNDPLLGEIALDHESSGLVGGRLYPVTTFPDDAGMQRSELYIVTSHGTVYQLLPTTSCL